MSDNSLYTNTGHKLTINENKFIDEYIKTGNARQSYITAYAKDPENPPSGANVMCNRLLHKVYIANEIEFRANQLHDSSIADAKEIMQYFTDVMRGNVKDQFGLDAPLGERTKAAQELAKRQIDIANKAAANEQPEVKIVLDWTPLQTPPTTPQPLEVNLDFGNEENN